MKTTLLIVSLICGAGVVSFAEQSESRGKPGSAIETEQVDFVSDFFRLLQSSEPPGERDEDRMFSGLGDVKACLGVVPEYKTSKTPIWDFLRSKKQELFGNAKPPYSFIIFLPTQTAKSAKQGNLYKDCVFAVARLNQESANPPMMVVVFSFTKNTNNPKLSGAPVFIKSETSQSLYDLALGARNAAKIE